MLKDNDLEIIKNNLSFWIKLNEKEKNLFINNISKIFYNNGEIVSRADSGCLGLMLIKSGGLRVYMMSEDGREVTLYRLSKRESCVLSASCILKNITFDVIIEAEADTEVLLLNIDTLNKLNNENIYVENFGYKKIVHRFSEVMWAFEQIMFMSFDKRLATFLIDEMIRDKTTNINLTHEQIAKHMGSAREVVSRMLKSFESRGILKLSRGLIEIRDKEKLKKLLI